MAVVGVGLSFFAVVAGLAVMMAVALGPVNPLMALWVAVPAPAVFATLARTPPQHRMLRGAAKVYLIASALATFALWGAGWMVSGQLHEGALARDEKLPKYDLKVTDLTAETITLRTAVDAKYGGPQVVDGLWGLQGPSTYCQVTGGERHGEGTVWRTTHLEGQVKVGDRVRLDSWVWPAGAAPAGPMKAVTYRSPLGEFPALKLGDGGDVWAIFVHGKGAGTRQGIRVAPLLSELGIPSLFISYRNDEGAPASADGFYRYGQTEWRDLEGAIQYALDNGAERVVLIGWSMGGAIAAKFLYTSTLAQHVAALVMDAPMLDFEATVDFGARQRGIPSLVVAAGKSVSRYRYGVDWSSTDYVAEAAELPVPTLVIHGERDETVPLETSMAFAQRAGAGLVQLDSFPDAPHVASWNVDRQRYEETLRTFLTKVLK